MTARPPIFSVAVARPAEHRLTVKIREKDTANPIERCRGPAWALSRHHRPGRTAAIEVPKGTYDLVVWKVGYDVPILSTEVAADRLVELEATIVPEEDPDAIWQIVNPR